MKKRVRCWMIGSYLLVLVIFLLIYLAIQHQTEKKIQELYMERQTMTMNQMMLAVDEQVDAVRKMCLAIAQEPYVQYFPYVGKELSKFDYESITKLIQGIRRHYTDNPFIEDFYLFYENSGRIANANGFYPEEDFYQMEWAFEEPQMQERGKKLLREEGSFFLPAAWMVNGAKRTENIAFFYEISHGQGKREGKSAKLVVLLKKSWMDEMVMPISKQGRIRIQRAYDGEELYSFWGSGFVPRSAQEQGETLPDSRFSLGQGEASDKEDDGRYLITRLDAEKSGWRYESAMPYAIITEQMKEAVRPMGTGLFFYLLIGIPACFFLAVWNYKPIHQLTVHMEATGFEQEEGNRNEVDYIRSGIAHLHQKYEELEAKYDSTQQEFDSASRKLMKNRERLQEGTLLQLIGGYWQDEREIKERLHGLGIVFSYSGFCMAVIQVEEGTADKNRNAEETQLCLFVLKNVAQEFLSPMGMVLPVPADSEQIYLVLNLDDKERCRFLPEWELRLRDMMDYFHQELQMDISIGVGTVCGEFRQLNASFKKAKQALAYGFILGRPSLVVYDQIKKEENRRFHYGETMEKQLLGRLIRRDEQGCKELLDKLYQEALDQKISVEEGRHLHMLLADMAMRAIEKSNVHTEMAEECQDRVAGMFSSRTLPEAFSSLKELFVLLCKEQKESGQEPEAQIMQVIQEHYRDPAFSLAACAEHFGISPEHLSRTIKQLTGRNFVDIVNGLRLEQAKRLLLETNKKIEEIAELSGYGTAKSFFRSFKQAEGVSPGIWRKERKP